jgi:hypothetical protein
MSKNREKSKWNSWEFGNYPLSGWFRTTLRLCAPLKGYALHPRAPETQRSPPAFQHPAEASRAGDRLVDNAMTGGNRNVKLVDPTPSPRFDFIQDLVARSDYHH